MWRGDDFLTRYIFRKEDAVRIVEAAWTAEVEWNVGLALNGEVAKRGMWRKRGGVAGTGGGIQIEETLGCFNRFRIITIRKGRAVAAGKAAIQRVKVP